MGRFGKCLPIQFEEEVRSKEKYHNFAKTLVCPPQSKTASPKFYPHSVMGMPHSRQSITSRLKVVIAYLGRWQPNIYRDDSTPVAVVQNMADWSNTMIYFARSFSVGNSTCKPPWKILFFGTDRFAVHPLKALIENRR